MITKIEIEKVLTEMYEKRARDVTMRFSRGNANLSRGYYITEKQLDAAFGRAPWRIERDKGV